MGQLANILLRFSTMWSLEESTVGLVRGILSLIDYYVMIGLAFYEPVGYIPPWKLGFLNAPGSNMGRRWSISSREY
jgi:hypothetical protein